ncbi:MAG: hypothetical protein M1827_000661 [Pycnora praestabilis]|nr:MAG: hypothetical protein M1827_000661 [Pycnora praestabilis]
MSSFFSTTPSFTTFIIQILLLVFALLLFFIFAFLIGYTITRRNRRFRDSTFQEPYQLDGFAGRTGAPLEDVFVIGADEEDGVRAPEGVMVPERARKLDLTSKVKISRHKSKTYPPIDSFCTCTSTRILTPYLSINVTTTTMTHNRGTDVFLYIFLPVIIGAILAFLFSAFYHTYRRHRATRNIDRQITDIELAEAARGNSDIFSLGPDECVDEDGVWVPQPLMVPPPMRDEAGERDIVDERRPSKEEEEVRSWQQVKAGRCRSRSVLSETDIAMVK